MKTLNSYIDQSMNALLEQCGGFFSFSRAQFDKKAVQGKRYTSLGGGLYVLTECVAQFNSEYPAIIERGIAQDLKENGKAGVIRRELFNYECFYTGDISDCVDALDEYGITEAEIFALFNTIRTTEDVDC